MKHIRRVRPKIKDNTFVTYEVISDVGCVSTSTVAVPNLTPMTEDGPYQEPINNAVFRALLNELLSPYNVRVKKYLLAPFSLTIFFRVGQEPGARIHINVTTDIRDSFEGPKSFARFVAMNAAQRLSR